MVKKVKWHNRPISRDCESGDHLSLNRHREMKKLGSRYKHPEPFKVPIVERLPIQIWAEWREQTSVDCVGSSLRNKNRVTTHQLHGTKLQQTLSGVFPRFDLGTQDYQGNLYKIANKLSLIQIIILLSWQKNKSNCDKIAKKSRSVNKNYFRTSRIEDLKLLWKEEYKW